MSGCLVRLMWPCNGLARVYSTFCLNGGWRTWMDVFQCILAFLPPFRCEIIFKSNAVVNGFGLFIVIMVIFFHFSLLFVSKHKKYIKKHLSEVRKLFSASVTELLTTLWINPVFIVNSLFIHKPGSRHASYISAVNSWISSFPAWFHPD